MPLRSSALENQRLGFSRSVSSPDGEKRKPARPQQTGFLRARVDEADPCELCMGRLFDFCGQGEMVAAERSGCRRTRHIAGSRVFWPPSASALQDLKLPTSA